jgi:hypothetical protein
MIAGRVPAMVCNGACAVGSAMKEASWYRHVHVYIFLDITMHGAGSMRNERVPRTRVGE